MSIGSTFDFLVLKHAAHRTSQRVKWTSGASVLIVFWKVRRTDGRMDGRTEDCTDRRTDGQRSDRRSDGRSDGRTGGREDGRTRGRTGGRADAWTDGRTDARADERRDGMSYLRGQHCYHSLPLVRHSDSNSLQTMKKTLGWRF